MTVTVRDLRPTDPAAAEAALDELELLAREGDFTAMPS